MREQPLLTVMHTIWMREHNRVANALYSIYGASKTDEFYYQEARRIVIAEFQHITYNEYLSVILGNMILKITQQIFINEQDLIEYFRTKS